MEILGLVGSPRTGGNTDILMDVVLDGAQANNHRVKKLCLRDFDIGPCIDCRGCKKGERTCVLDDGMNELYERLDSADVIVFGTPVYDNASFQFRHATVRLTRPPNHLRPAVGAGARVAPVRLRRSACSRPPTPVRLLLDAPTPSPDTRFDTEGISILEETHIATTSMSTRLRGSLAAALVALATAAQSLSGQTPRSTIPLAQQLFQAVRPLMTGDTAYDITAFLDRRWRVPGNRGFDESLDRVVATLRAAGYVEERSGSASGRLTYRVERYPRRYPTWEPDSASLTIVGDSVPLLRFTTNFNMVAMYSFPTPPEGVEGELYEWRSRGDTSGLPRSLAGKIVVGDMSPGRLFVEAVQRRGALGVLAYEMLPYNRPEVNRTAIQDGFVPRDTLRRAFGIMLSREARDRLSAAMSRGPARVRVAIATRMWPSEERTLVAEARGASLPDERFVFSAHVNEAGANDNASGTGALAEMARVLAVLMGGRAADPLRTVTMMWGSEISSTQRYLSQDSARLRGVRWGMSLDMVGENTSVTGGTFLLEKMPDPSAVWTRGEDRHSEWGGRPISVRDIRPHYYNDFVLNRCRDQGAAVGWAVSANPYEGGSDHVPFLLANKPAVQLWHFTDQFYHTDLDRIDKVSRSELANVGSCALVIALTLASADGPTARAIVADIEASAIRRLDTELALSRAAIATGRPVEQEALIVATWGSYYRDGIRAAADIEAGGSSAETLRAIEAAALLVERAAASRAGSLRR